MNIHIPQQGRVNNNFSSLEQMLIDLQQFNQNNCCPVILDNSNYHLSHKTNSIIVLKKTEFEKVKNNLPINSVVLMVTVASGQRNILINNISQIGVTNGNNGNIDVLHVVISNVGKMIVLFLQQNGFPIYSSIDQGNNINDFTMWNLFNNVKLKIQLLHKDSQGTIYVRNDWNGSCFKNNDTPVGMEIDF